VSDRTAKDLIQQALEFGELVEVEDPDDGRKKVYKKVIT